MRFIDCHTHVQFAAFEKDYKEVIKRALDNNVFLVNVGTQKDTSRRAVEIANEYKEGVYAAVGVHPIHTDASYHDPEEIGLHPSHGTSADIGTGGFTSRGEEFDFEYYKRLAMDPKVVAIGETGLDYYRATMTNDDNHDSDNDNDDGKRRKQKEVFGEHIRLAGEIGKPLMIHCRQAFPDLIGILTKNFSLLIPERPGVVHFFSGTMDDAKKLLDMGFYFTFGGVITFVRDYDAVIRFIPTNRILSETDAPYVTPAPYRGKRNEPAYVVEVVKKLAELKGISAEEMKEKIWENAGRVFGL